VIRRTFRKIFKVFIKSVPIGDKIAMFRELGVSLDVRSFTCDGRLGIFEGSIHDMVVHDFYLRYNNWAAGLQAILERIFRDGKGTYIDIGANIGLTTIPIVRKKDIQCFAFEPEINSYFSLRKNIIANGVEQKVKAFNVALFSDDCILEMELSNINSGDHRIRVEQRNVLNGCQYNESSRRTAKVRARKLDSVLMPERLIKPVVMKVDTQGSEVRVFRGAEKCLNLVDYLIVEYWPYGLLRIGDSTEAFIQAIRQFQYGAMYDDSKLGILELRPIEELINVISSIPQNNVNIEHTDIVLSRSRSFLGEIS